jgi:xanthine dehydrogenase accessory factor
MVPNLAREEAVLVARREPYVRVTVVWAARPVSARPGDTAIITADGRIRGWVGGSCSEPVVVRHALAALTEGRPTLIHVGPAEEMPSPRPGTVVAPVSCASEGALDVFVEPRLPPLQLVTVGRSPLVRALATMAAAVGFEVTMVERDGIERGGLETMRVMDGLDLIGAGAGPTSFVVIATMGRYDEEALEAALACDARYVGLVASPRRGGAVLDALRSGGVPESDLARVRVPAGLDLGDLHHEEIAVAILAEIVSERAKAQPAASVSALSEEIADPVCGMTMSVDQAHQALEHAGVTYWFCSSACRRRFDEAPARFLITH